MTAAKKELDKLDATPVKERWAYGLEVVRRPSRHAKPLGQITDLTPHTTAAPAATRDGRDDDHRNAP